MNPNLEKMISDLDEQCFPSDQRPTIKGRYWWVVHVRWNPKVGPIAYAGLSVPTGNYGFMARVGVLPQYRGHGLQIELIKRRETFLRAHGINTSITYTHPMNCASSNNLIKTGYLTYEPQQAYAGYNFIYWRKNLAKKRQS